MEMDTIITCLTENLEKLIEKKKEYDDALKSLEVERPDFFYFFLVFSNIFHKPGFWTVQVSSKF